jgi:hypothetical protein
MTHAKTQRISTAVALAATLAMAAPVHAAGREGRVRGKDSGVLVRAWSWVVEVMSTSKKGAGIDPNGFTLDEGVTPAPPPQCVEGCDKGAGIDPNG